MRDRLVARGWHHTFGWLRRPELDVEASGFCYEKPEGEIIVSKLQHHRYGMYMHCYEDRETKELYITPSSAPRLYRRPVHARR